MFSGLLNEKIDIYSFVKTKDDRGIITEEKTLKYTTRAKVIHKSGSRSVINDNIQFPYNKTFVMRIYVPITEDDWIFYEDKNWRVLSIDRDKGMQQIVVDTEIVQE